MQNENYSKVVAITGASSGIGRAIAIELARNGFKVVLGARNLAQLKKVVDEIVDLGGKAVFSKTDVRDKLDLILLVETAIRHYGKLDIIVNNAGVTELSRIDELDIEGWENMIDVNLKGVLYGMAASIPIFKEQKRGHIINIVSVAGLQVSPMMGVYAGTKNAVRTIAEAFRQESDGAIRITGISPGFVKTNLVEGIKNQEMRDTILENMNKMAISPTDIAASVMFAINQPDNVEIGDIVIRPAKQN
jgi:NADP-dependent 3-hydroxy acid dehydrogenase YdfG